MTVISSTKKLHQRRCSLRLSDHKYIWEPTGEQMAASVTGVISFFDKPYDGDPMYGEVGTHVHRFLPYLGQGIVDPDLHLDIDDGIWSPEGHNCKPWIDNLKHGEIKHGGGRTMEGFWSKARVIATEYTMVHRKKSLGGQFDLLVELSGKIILIDLKTKQQSWTSAHKNDAHKWKAQAGGYLYLITNGDDAKGGCWIDECRTLIVTPKAVYWQPPMKYDECYFTWEDCWLKYSAYAEANPFSTPNFYTST